MALVIILILIYVAIFVAIVWAYVRIIQRSGYSGWWVLMALVPIGNIVMLMLFAFKEWPIQRELAQWRAWGAAQHHAQAGHGGQSYPSAYGRPGDYPGSLG
ncbi:MAG: hypothetical protein ACRDRN_22380 [Sciscionella sp.]